MAVSTFWFSFSRNQTGFIGVILADGKTVDDALEAIEKRGLKPKMNSLDIESYDLPDDAPELSKMEKWKLYDKAALRNLQIGATSTLTGEEL